MSSNVALWAPRASVFFFELGALVGAIQCLRTLLVHVWTQCVYLLSIGSVVAVFVRRLLFLLCML